MSVLGNQDLPRKSYYEAFLDSSRSIIIKAKEFRHNPELFQKISQVVLSCLRLLIHNFPQTDYLTRLSLVLLTVNMHDFYASFKIPKRVLLPFSAENIDEYKLAYILDNLLKNKDPTILDGVFSDFLHEDLKPLLKKLAERGAAYRGPEKLKDMICACIVKKFPMLAAESFEELKIPFRHTPLLEIINNIMWAVVDLSCVTMFFQMWNLVDTAKWSEKLGQCCLFGWVKNRTLEQFVVGSAAISFMVKFIESTRKLLDDKLTDEDRKQNRWNVGTSLLESVFLSAIYTNIIGKTQFSFVHLQCLAILAKSLGVLSLVTKPKHEYFQTPLAVA